MSIKYKLFKELFKMSSAAAQKSFQIFSTFAVVDPTQPTKNWKISTQPNPTQTIPTQPMGQPNPWTTLILLLLKNLEQVCSRVKAKGKELHH